MTQADSTPTPPPSTDSPARLDIDENLPNNPEIHEVNNTSEAFAWPPHEVAIEDASSASAPWREKQSRTTARISFAPRWLQSLEKCWLAPTALPLAIRIKQAQWRPDEPDVYCDVCGMSIGPHEADEFGCSSCRENQPPWDRFIRLGEYDGALARWIKEAKFHGQRRLAFELGQLLGQAALRAGIPMDRLAVTSVGMAPLRRLSRGYDQAAEIARGAASELSCPLVHAFRRQHRPSQRSVPMSKRKKNIAGSFALKAGVDFTGWSVLIVDDVRTTGATLTQACFAMNSAKNKQKRENKWVAALAVTPSHDRRTQSDRSPRQPEIQTPGGPMRRVREDSQGTPIDSPLDRAADVGTVAAPVDE